MLIYLVRHGQTVFNTQGRIQGQQDSPLTETGIATTQKTALALKDKGITTIVSSCLGRAQQTSQILAQNLGAKIVLDERLNEIRLTPWEGRRKQDLIKENNQEYISYITKPHQYTSTQCEEFGHLMQRTYACLCDVVERYKGETLLLVSHEIALRTLLLAIKKQPVTADFWKTIVPQSSITTVSFDGKELVLNAGDSIYFNPLYPHGQKCGGNVPAKFLTMITE